MSAVPGTQQLRFRKPLKPSTARSATLPDAKPIEDGEESIVKEVQKTTQRKKTLWSPSFSVAFRMLLLVRFCAAMYSNISDCDEVFNFWEPLHYALKGYGFQTWEVSPAYAIRSWAYIFLHYPLAIIGAPLSSGKRPSFFALRISLGLISSLCEAQMIQSVAKYVNARVGSYLFFMLLTSAGMWSASTAFLPSTFAMYCNMLGFAFALKPSTNRDDERTLFATISFAAGAIVGWPFSILASFPFVFEELFVYSGDKVADVAVKRWLSVRWIRMLGSVTLSAFLFIPVIAIDSTAYGRLAIVPWNIIHYNIFGGADRGPNLYGTEPWYFYIFNLILNFNALAPLALFALPALLITRSIDYTRLGAKKHTDQETSPYMLIGLRLSPFYLWLIVLSLQPHKEERFMFPVYPILCFNAAVALFLIRGWLEKGYTSITSQYQASRSPVMRIMTTNVLVATFLISFLRIAAQFCYYNAPLGIAFDFEHKELPRLLNATNLLPPLPEQRNAKYDPDIDLTPIAQFNLRLCVGKEWYRFPGHFLIPNGIETRFIKSEFDGLLPQPFHASSNNGLWPWSGMRVVPEGLNDLNKENPLHYVEPASCDYLIDLDFPSHPRESSLEPRFIKQDAWEAVHCREFLDAANSPMISRILWLPGDAWWQKNEYGDYCLLRNKERAARREGNQRADYH